ncbi:hypothetical protein HK103_000844 [Boothiomyces macroporosus]|uniref:Ankyrin repeat protein n=1 Tax=Boothiomyces macroporosus TaxID=261099 RepID=A0AAD5UBF1_9FUNG|nr:hypothetical protein HK103_000844 [Boothiomyces macroporosus]
MLHQISNELGMIGQYLPVSHYHALRLAFRSSLPPVQLINPLSLQKPKTDISNWITIPSNRITDAVIWKLFDYGLHQSLCNPDYTIPKEYACYFLLQIINSEFLLNPQLVLKLLPLIPDGTVGFVGNSLETAKCIHSSTNVVPYLSFRLLVSQCLKKGYNDLVLSILTDKFVAVNPSIHGIERELYSVQFIDAVMKQPKVKESLGSYDILNYPVAQGMTRVVEIILSYDGIGYLSENVKIAFAMNHHQIARMILTYSTFDYSSVLKYDKDLFEFVYDNVSVPQEYIGQMFLAAVEKESRVFDSLFDQAKEYGTRALLIACEKGYSGFILKLLASPHIDPNIAKSAKKWYPDLLPHFISHPRFVVENEWVVEHCLNQSDLECLLSDKRIDPTTNNYLLKYAANKADVGMLRLLLPLEFNLSVDNNYVFRKLVSKKAKSMLELLLDDSRFTMELPDSWLKMNGLKM